MGQQLRTQDDACTRDPIFVVQQRKRIYGMDGDYVDQFAWITDDADCDEADIEEAAKLEAKYESDEETPGWMRVAYHDTWEFVQPFFTRAAAEAFIARNAHRLTDPRVYVDSAYRNPEWQAVREHLMVLASAPPNRKHAHYFKPTPFESADVYRILRMFNVADPCIQHAVKKLLVAGGRGGGKDIGRDIQEAVDTLLRWQDMQAEDAAASEVGA